mgnify:CR=1 FL=1
MHSESNPSPLLTSSLSKLGRAALAYVGLGLRVIPLAGQGKVPILQDWGSRGTLLPEIVKDWWTEWPNANVGGLTGRGLAVVDIDPANGGLISLEALQDAHGPIPLTPTVKTGSGGTHFWFRLPGGLRLPNSAGRLGPGVDVRGDGGQVVLPPSIHPNLTPYSWLGEARIGEVPFAPMPEWMLFELAGATTGATAAPVEWTALADDGAAEGTRNASLARIAGHLFRRFVNPPLAVSLVKSWNAVNCHPPLPEREVETIIESIAGRELRRREGA